MGRVTRKHPAAPGYLLPVAAPKIVEQICIAFGARPDRLTSVSRSSFRLDLPPSSSALDPPVSLRELDYPRAPSFKRVEEEIWKSKKRGTNQCPTFAKAAQFSTLFGGRPRRISSLLLSSHSCLPFLASLSCLSTSSRSHRN